MPIRAVTFDCWQTLITDSVTAPANDERARVLALAGRLDDGAARALLERAWRAHHDAWVGGEQFGSVGIARLVVTELGLDRSAADELCRRLEDASLLSHVEPLAGASETLSSLRAAGIRTALVCDTGFTPGRLVREFLARFGFHLDHLVFSNEIGVPKPHPLMFLTALDAVEVRPHEAVHVGDLLRTDIAGARAVGMRTVRLAAVNTSGLGSALPGTPPGATDAGSYAEADAVVSSHEELTGALRLLGVPL